jgi:ABC-type transporter Mla subunit MlaD
LSGFVLVLITWARGGRLGRGGRPYRCVLRFPLACGIGVGTPVRIRGVPVGSVVGVEASLDAVSVLAEIRDAGTVIPRTARIEANQSGLIAEPLIDITPTAPAPPSLTGGGSGGGEGGEGGGPSTTTPPAASPLDTAACEAEGLIVCHGGVIRGVQGVSLDDLVLIMTRMARKLDAGDGVDRLLDATELASAALEDARPLLSRAASLADQALPILTDLRAGGLGGQVADLITAALGAAGDIRALQGEVLTPGNVRALRDAVGALARTLEHVEGIAGDVGGLTGDARVRGNLKQLIEALGRIVAD